MFIRMNNLEKGMDITYADIKRQREDLDKKYDARKTLLCEAALNLHDQYWESLKLQNPLWKDHAGIDRPYVTIGILNDKNEFVKTNIRSIPLTENYSLQYKISTIIDDSPLTGGGQYLVSISMDFNNGVLAVNVGGQKTFTVPRHEDKDAFCEVCIAIKQLMLAGFTDPRLG